MTILTTVYLVRHAITADLQAGRLQGQQRDGGILAEGVAPITRLAEPLRGKAIAAFYTSDLQRAVVSASLLREMLNEDIPVRHEPRLREIDFGAWEGLTLAEVQARYPDEPVDPYRVPWAVARYGGETIDHLVYRLREFWNALLPIHQGQSVLLVSHAQALSALLCLALDLPIGDRWRFGIDPASLTTLLVGESNTAVLYRLNYT